NWGKALKEMYTHVCKTAKRVKKQVANYVKKIDWKKVAVTTGAIGVGIALTVATGGLGAPVAMAIGGAASGAIISGYDAYSSGQRGWALAGSTLKGAGLGALTGFVGGQLMGAGATVASNLTQNIGHQTVRQVARVGIEAGVETAIDTGLSVATGNPITLKNVVTDYGLNLVTNGSGSVAGKKTHRTDLDAMAAPKNKTNGLGEELATTKDIRNYKKQWGNQGIKVKVDKKGKILPSTVEAGFDNINGVIYIRKDPTKINLYHEGYHAQQWLDIGSENYQNLTRLQREEYVFDEIMKNKHLFDEASIQHSINYIERLRGGR
uniref:zincin-like metallopeptidase toxin domain-containing protein n=1 Tax=Streptococcus suis TaxID=1307 RepID=UPI000462E433